jgi:flagellar basal body-associated protein FliL
MTRQDRSAVILIVAQLLVLACLVVFIVLWMFQH